MILFPRLLLASCLCLFAGSAVTLAQEVVLAEFLARNETTVTDEDGVFADWLEVVNRGDTMVSLDGWSLTDEEDRPRKWRFPEGASLAPGEHRLIFATGRDEANLGGTWHTNFRLAAPGEYLALIGPDGEPSGPVYPAAPQFDDVSYGQAPSGEVGYLAAPTPGDLNSELALPGPRIVEVVHSPEVVAANEDITVTAQVLARTAAVAEVFLHHRVDHKGEGTLPMRDDGTGEDVTAGDGLYTAVISGRTLFGPRIPAGSVARWRVTARDAEGQESRFPPYLDREGVDQSAEYEGVLVDLEVDTELPVFHWFTGEEGNARNRTGARASVAYGGRFYDNVYVRQRGGATNGQSQKFAFNKAYPIEVNEEMPAVSELNLNAQGSDATYLRQPLAFETYRWAGNASSISFLTKMYLNGEEDRTGVLIEQVDEDFLERNGFDPLGELYKLVQRSNLMPVFADATTGVEKKTNEEADFSRFQTLVDGLALSGEARKAYLMDSLNLPQVINYLAVRSITQDADDVRKNFYVYQDSRGSEEWSIFPWDKDWTFGVTGDGGPHLKHPFFGDEAHLKTNANQWNRLYDAVFGEAVTRQMYLRRLRTLTDELLQAPETPPSERRFENRLDALFAEAEGDVPNNAASSVKAFFPERRRDLLETYGPGGREPLLPRQQESLPPIAFGEILFSPSSGNQDEEYIQLLNEGSVPVDVSGWTVEGGVKWTMAPGTVIPAASLFTPGINVLYLSPDVVAFRGREESPKGGEGHFVQGPYRGHLSNLGEELVLRDAAGAVIAETLFEGNPSDVERYLVVSEIMYHPGDEHPGSEFLELANLSSEVTLDLSGLTFTRGLDFAFAEGIFLAPGQVVLLIEDEAAFVTAYGEGLPVAGVYGAFSRLSNGGETLKLEDSQGNTVLEFEYDDEGDWPVEADGGGHSLVLGNLSERLDPELPGSWTLSALPGGSPGEAGGGGTLPPGGDFRDGDGDGLVALLEEAFGSSDADPTEGPQAVVLREEQDGLRVEVWMGDSTIGLTLEVSQDLQTWTDAEAEGWERSQANAEGERPLLIFRGDRVSAGRYLRLRAAR